MGSPDYPPNRGAIEGFARSIFPLVKKRHPGARFLAVGANPPASLKRLETEVSGVELVGYVEDILPMYTASTVVVVPIRVGGGTRTKILESLALGRPVVSTPVGAEGLPVEHEKNILIADTEEAFAGAVLAVHSDEILSRTLVEAGRDLVETHGSAHHAGRRLEEVLLKTLEKKGHA